MSGACSKGRARNLLSQFDDIFFKYQYSVYGMGPCLSDKIIISVFNYSSLFVPVLHPPNFPDILAKLRTCIFR